jgi:uncharacterized protein (DUF1501 family)
MDITRRKFLGGGVGMLLGSSQLFSIAARAATFEPRKPGSSKILVIVQMAGGNDGINTVIPYGLGKYYDLRPNLGIKPHDVLPLTGSVGLHPNMTGLRDVYKSGKLAVGLGVGYPNPNRSHFRSIEIWQTAEPEKVSNTGWLGRYLDASASRNDTASKRLFPAINVDPMLPKSLASDHVMVPSVSDVNQFKFNTDAHYQLDRQRQIEAFNSIYSSFDIDRPSSHLLKEVGLDAMQASDYLLKVTKNYKSDVKYPDNGFGRSMKFISQMITAGVDARVYNVSLGGFDTHANQLRVQGNLLKQFSDTMAAFQKDLEHHSVDQDVVVMAFSEFGRRVAENNGRGTDHGTAEPVFIMGSAVKGGLYGDYPSLTDLDSGDLKFTIDFRNVYATLIDKWLGADSNAVLGARYEPIGFLS